MSFAEIVLDFLLFIGLTTFIGLPVFAVAYRQGKVQTMRRFGVATAVVAVVVTVLSVTSELLVAQCLDAGNTGCVDYGATGLQTLVLALFTAASLITTVRLVRD